MSEPVRIFVGASPDQLDLEAEIALEHSVRSRSSLPVELHWMRLSRDRASPFYSGAEHGQGHDTKNWMTPFTGFRWLIPQLCDFTGRAIYMDYDMLVLADIAELWRLPLGRQSWFAAREPSKCCVMLIDCARRGFNRSAPMQRLDPGWNCLDGDGMKAGDPRIKILHFTTIYTQPHLSMAAKRLASVGRAHWFKGQREAHWRPDLVKLWEREYAAGVKAGYGEKPAETFGPIPLYPTISYRGMIGR